MNAITRITASADIDLTAIIRRDGIAKIEDYLTHFSVVLKDGRLGIGKSVGEALAKAKAPDADNVRRLAA